MDGKTSAFQSVNDWKTIDINNLFNKLIAFNYQGSKFSDKTNQFKDDLCRLFESLLWAQKKSPQILFTLFDMHSLQQVQERHLSTHAHLFFKNYILIMMNSCEGGLLTDLLLEHRLPHSILEQYLKSSQATQNNDEVLEYVGSFLKAYHRIFHPSKIQSFIISDEYFELLEVSFKFFNCPEPLTNTTVFTIVLALLKHRQVKDFILACGRREFYCNILDQLTKSFRNQLAQFGLRIRHFSKNDDVQFIMGEIDDKIALWEDISQAVQGLQQLIQLPFSKNVILPLLIGPLLKATSLPLFTLKFSLFIIHKLFPIIHKLGMLEIVLHLIFIEDNVFFWPNQLFKAKVIPFKFQRLMNKQIERNEEQEKEQFGPGIKQFYQGLFRSKDNHFILITTSLLCSICRYLPTDAVLIKQCGLNPAGFTNLWISQILINQLSELHCLNTLASIINTLVLLCQGQKLYPDHQNRYNFMLRNMINQATVVIKKNNKHWDGLIQTTQFDLTFSQKWEFGKQMREKKHQQLYKIVFTWDQQKEEDSCNSFYSCIPDTPLDNIRYLFVKFLLLRKGCAYLLDSINFTDLIADYYSKIIIKSPFIQGDTYRLSQIKQNFIQCQLIQEKDNLTAIWIKDDQFFVVAFLQKQKKEAHIISSVKYKHLTTHPQFIKSKMLLKIQTKSWHPQNQRMLDHKNAIKLKGLQIAPAIISQNQCLSRQKQLSFILRALRKTEESLPDISLI